VSLLSMEEVLVPLGAALSGQGKPCVHSMLYTMGNTGSTSHRVSTQSKYMVTQRLG